MPSIKDRLQHAWNAFNNKDPTFPKYSYTEHTSSYRPDRAKIGYGNDRSMVTPIINRIAMDCAAIDIEHVRLDERGRYSETIESGLNTCLTVEANRDQTGRAFRQDVFMSLLDEGCIAIVPVDTTFSPVNTDSYEIRSVRVGKILEWSPTTVKVRLYNENKGEKEDVVLPKKACAIVENPLYAIMNEKNSTLQRLIHKINLLDVVDEQSSNGKLDLIVQLPYTIKTEARQKQAENRRKAIEEQLSNSKYGIAYTDSTEHITQLNRSLENNLMEQVKYLTEMLYSQLGITQEIMNGTASDADMLNYNNRTIEPIISAVVDEMKRKFLTKTARTQGQSILFFRDPFRLVPVSQLADIADKFTRNEILSSNEVRQIIGFKPVDNDKADELRNKNLNVGDGQEFTSTTGEDIMEIGEGGAAPQNGEGQSSEPKADAPAPNPINAQSYLDELLDEVRDVPM